MKTRAAGSVRLPEAILAIAVLCVAFFFLSQCRRNLNQILAPLLDSPAKVRPRITASNPSELNGAYIQANPIYVEFDRPMDLSATERAFSLGGNATPSGKTRWEGNRLFFDLDNPLAPGFAYVLRVGGSAKSAEGNTMEVDYIVHFIAGSRIDAPTVVMTEPPANAQGVNGATQIILGFSRSMNRSSVEQSLTISPPTYGRYSWTGNDTILAFTPFTDLITPSVYSVSLSTSASDIEGIALSSPFSFSFQTGNDLVRPTVTDLREQGSIAPVADGQNGVFKDAAFVISFSEPMQAVEAGNSISLIRTDDGSSVSLDLFWTPSGGAVTVKPRQPLEPLSSYRISISTGAKDLSGNALLSRFERNFLVSNAGGARNSVYLTIDAVSLVLPLPVQDVTDLSPNHTTDLIVTGSDNATEGAMATFQIDFSHSVDPATLPENILITKTLGVHPAGGRLLGIQLIDRPGLAASRVNLVISELGANNEYQLQIYGGNGALRSIAAGGETPTWMKKNVEINFRVKP